MNTSKVIWTILFVLGGLFLLYRGLTGHGLGQVYVRHHSDKYVEVKKSAEPDDENQAPIRFWVKADSDEAKNLEQTGVAPITRGTNTQTSVKAYAHQENLYPAEGVDLAELAAVQDMTEDELVDELKRLTEETDHGAGKPKDQIFLSVPRTIGVWIAAFFTLCIFSFLYRDNPFYKLAESIVVGVSAAYWMVVGFWSTIVGNLFMKLTPGIMRELGWLPGIGRDKPAVDWEYWAYFVPLILGIMLLWRLSPKGGWIARWPLAFIIGTTAGLRLFGFMGADFLSQIKNAIAPLIVTTAEPQYDRVGDAIVQSARSILLFVGLMSGLVYFFFSVEHRGFVGKTAKVGIWFLMITFGAGFGYTVMGRIALLAIRLEFLFDDWLWLIDPRYLRPPGW